MRSLCRRLRARLAALSPNDFHSVRMLHGTAVAFLMMDEAGWTLTRSAITELDRLEKFLNW